MCLRVCKTRQVCLFVCVCVYRAMDTQWGNVKEKLNAEAMRVSSVASTLEQQALQPLQVYLLADLDKRFHSLVQDGRKLIRDLYTAKSSLMKTKEKYYK